jgi:hypothetical protein
MKKANFIKEVTVTDPDTGGEVQVSIFKDSSSGAMFGIDSSYIEQCLDEDPRGVVKSPFNDEHLIMQGV